MKIAHPNRQLHNWLMYECYESWLERNSGLFRGALFDLGCGDGSYKKWALQYCESYTGVDWPNSAHEIKPDVTADLNQPLPIDSDTADTVLCLSVLEHLSEPQKMLNEAYRILKPNGNIILQVPWQWWIHEAPYDYFRFTPYALKLLFNRAGFTQVNVEPQAGFFTTFVMKGNYFSRRAVRGPAPIRYAALAGLSVFWYFSQKAAPLLDKLDRNWTLEAPGYFVTAKKIESEAP